MRRKQLSTLCETISDMPYCQWRRFVEIVEQKYSSAHSNTKIANVEELEDAFRWEFYELFCDNLNH